jgi:membrane protein DedA with SNARE-associated domain
MNLNDLLQQFLNLAGTFNLRLIIFLFLLCSIGEFSVVTLIPYALDTVWILSGYHLSTGAISPLQMFILWSAAQAGRQTGATLLYFVGKVGKVPFARFYRKHFDIDLMTKLSPSGGLAAKLIRRIDLLSPFSVALGRLLWLRFPLTLTLGATRHYKVLFLGVLFSSIVWDGIYIFLGVIGAQVVQTPTQMLLYSLLGLTVFYVIAFIVRRVARLVKMKRGDVNTEK